MDRQDIIRRIMSTYENNGIKESDIEEGIESGLQLGYSYKLIYIGIRMTLGNCYKVREYFTTAEIADAFEMEEKDVIANIEKNRKQLIEFGEDPGDYFINIGPKAPQCFILLPDAIQRFFINPSDLKFEHP